MRVDPISYGIGPAVHGPLADLPAKLGGLRARRSNRKQTCFQFKKSAITLFSSGSIASTCRQALRHRVASASGRSCRQREAFEQVVAPHPNPLLVKNGERGSGHRQPLLLAHRDERILRRDGSSGRARGRRGIGIMGQYLRETLKCDRPALPAHCLKPIPVFGRKALKRCGRGLAQFIHCEP
jgi:hypothetical protein